ncbi:MAG: hypothetical protein WCD86_11615 [Ktedonobacteraceae bacterium]
MIARGISDIKGIRRVNTRPGPITESSGLLKLYLLAAEKDTVQKKLAWVGRQQEQAEKRLSEIAHTMQTVKKSVEEIAGRESTSNAHTRSHTTFIEY